MAEYFGYFFHNVMKVGGVLWWPSLISYVVVGYLACLPVMVFLIFFAKMAKNLSKLEDSLKLSFSFHFKSLSLMVGPYQSFYFCDFW